MNFLLSKVVCRAMSSVFDAFRGKFPHVVRVETTNACNAQCVICPHQAMRRSVRQMDDRLFARIVDECAAHGCREVHLHNFGEPLLDRRLEEKIRHVKARGVHKVKIFTNGSLLSEERARGLIDAGLDEIKVSMDGATREEFEQIRTPLKYNEVVRNLMNLVAIRNAAGSPMEIRLACVSTSDKDAMMRRLENTVDAFSFGKIHNWASPGRCKGGIQIRKPCSRLWRTFTILAGGEVPLCCLDFNGQVILGNVASGASIAEIWNGAAYRLVRAQHRGALQAELALCHHCTKAFLYQSKPDSVVAPWPPREVEARKPRSGGGNGTAEDQPDGGGQAAAKTATMAP